MNSNSQVTDFIVAACVPRKGSHMSGNLERAEALLLANPDIRRANIHTAAILGDDDLVRRLLTADRANATAKGGPYDWDALTHLCFSRYLRLDRPRSGAFLRAATALLDAGANPNTGWFEQDHQPKPEWESALYGAAGVAHDAELTRLLLERGADPNDGETPYHAPESRDNGVVEALLASGKLNEWGLITLLIRKADWHDYDGMKLVLAHVKDPNQSSHWGRSVLQHALLRDNALRTIELLLDHGADPTRVENGRSGVALAASQGRSDVLGLFRERGIPFRLSGIDELIAACALGDHQKAQDIARREPALADEVRGRGAKLLAEFSGTCNPDGVRELLDLGVPVDALYKEGDGYWDQAPDSTALHVAAWRACPPVVKLLVERGADVNATNAKGRTPLGLAVRACVDSYWTEYRSPDSVAALLAAGANPDAPDVRYPSGYDAVDTLLQSAKLHS